jgi:tRNA-modifying protein YgfZ
MVTTMRPLQDYFTQSHVECSAVAGGQLPVVFRTVEAEHAAVTAAAGLFDHSLVGKLQIRGPDAPKFLTNLSTNNLGNLPVGGGCELYFLDHKAKTLFACRAYHLMSVPDGHSIWLETTAGRGGKLFQHLDRYLISEAVELNDLTEQYAQLHLAGPKARSILETALGQPLPDLGEFLHLDRTFPNAIPCSIRRHDPLNRPGFDLVCSVEYSVELWKLLIANGAEPAGHQTWETLRIEAVTPEYGIDIDESRFVLELPRVARAIDYTKGCFIGQEPIIMSRDRAGFVNRALLPMKIESNGLLAAGTKLFRGTEEVGVVTSSIQSIQHGGPIAMGYIRRLNQDPGLKLDAETPHGKVTVELLPFPG